MALCLTWGVVIILLAIFRCRPILAAWNANYPGRSCIDLQPLYYATASSNVALDIVVNLLPARQIWGLQLPLKQRVLLIICMCLGVLSIAAGIGRILTIPSLIASNLPATIPMPFLFTIIEPAFAIICACLPTYRPLALWVGHGIKHSRYGSRMRSLISHSSMAKSTGSGSGMGTNHSGASRKSRASLFFARWGKNATPSANEKEVLTSANTTPEVGMLKDEREYEQGWGAPGHRNEANAYADGNGRPTSNAPPRPGAAL